MDIGTCAGENCGIGVYAHHFRPLRGVYMACEKAHANYLEGYLDGVFFEGEITRVDLSGSELEMPSTEGLDKKIWTVFYDAAIEKAKDEEIVVYTRTREGRVTPECGATRRWLPEFAKKFRDTRGWMILAMD